MSDERIGRALSRIEIDERPGFRDDLRARLLAQVGPVAVARRSRRAPLGWWRAAAIGTAAIVLTASASGYAAADSRPGDPAFGLKHAYEDLLARFADSDERRLELATIRATARAQELRRARTPEAARHGLHEYLQALERVDGLLLSVRSTPPGPRRTNALGGAAEALAGHESPLDAVLPMLPDRAREAIERAREVRERAGAPGQVPPVDPPARPVDPPGPPAEPPARPPAPPHRPVDPPGPPANRPGPPGR